MKVGILTWHYYNNIGSNLQAFALNKVISDLGYSTTFINYRQKKYDDNKLKVFLKALFCSVNKVVYGTLPEKYRFGAFQFQRENFKLTRKIFDSSELATLNKDFDIFVCGSDQIWAPNVFDKSYMLSFADESKVKIAYAASIGLSEIPKELQPEYKTWISRLDAVSVREKEGKALLAQLGINAVHVLDPTFLLPSEQWMNISVSEYAPSGDSGDYVCVYFLGQEKWHREWVFTFSRKHHLKIVMISLDRSDRKYADKYYSNISPTKFLKYIERAKYIFTDSFHGMTFSIIYNKPFYIFDRFRKDDKINQNSRIESLANMLGLEDRRLQVDHVVERPEIDYQKVNIQLEMFRSESLTYLSNALSIKK